jgi:hypothetical protein
MFFASRRFRVPKHFGLGRDAALASPSPSDEAQKEQKNDRPYGRDDQAGDPPAIGNPELPRQESAYERAHDANQKIGQKPMIPIHGLLGDPAREHADDDCADKAYTAHGFRLLLRRPP